MNHRSNVRRLVAAMCIISVVGALAPTGPVRAVDAITPNNDSCELTTGSGTAAAPYQISSALTLQEIGDCDDSYKYYKVTANISLAPSDSTDWNKTANGGWKPISEGGAFTGSFDGGGKTISGLAIDRLSGSNQGLFTSISRAYIANVVLSGSVKGDEFTGGLAGSADDGTVIENVASSVTVSASAGSVGGIVGKAVFTSFDTVTVSGAVQVDDSVQRSVRNLGGLVGLAEDSSFHNVKMNSPVSGYRMVSGGGFSVASYVGGIVGRSQLGGGIDSATIAASSSITGGFMVGGAVGYAYQSPLTLVTVAGAVTGAAPDPWSYVGGLAGQADETMIVDSKVTGAVAAGSNFVGGAVGNSLRSSLARVTTSGAVTANGSVEYLGGIAGSISEGVIVDSSTSGAVTCGTAAITTRTCGKVGGIAGYSEYSALWSVRSSRAISGNSGTADAPSIAIGGISGLMVGGSLVAATSSGAITLTNATSVGGLVGSSFTPIIRKSTSSSSLTVSNLSASTDIAVPGELEFVERQEVIALGGMVGWSDGTLVISQSSVTGNVTGTGWAAGVGGFVGYIDNASSAITIKDSYSRGNVTGTADVGGIIGTTRRLKLNASIRLKNVYTTGTVTAPTKTKAGGTAAISSNVATISWGEAKAHTFALGDSVTVSGCSNTSVNGVATITAVSYRNPSTISFDKTAADVADVTGCNVTGKGAFDAVGNASAAAKFVNSGVLYLSGASVLAGTAKRTTAQLRVLATSTATQKANIFKTYTNAGYSSSVWAISAKVNGGYAYIK